MADKRKQKKRKSESDTLTEIFFQLLANERTLNMARNLGHPASPIPSLIEMQPLPGSGRLDPLRKPVGR